MSEGSFVQSEIDTYEASTTRILNLKSQLPTRLVEDLAREVLSRVARGPRQDATIDSSEASEVDDLCRALISTSHRAGAEFIKQVRSRGTSAETIYLEYLAASARQLGVWWENDQVTFADVTIGSSRIYGIMRTLRRHFEPTGADPTKSAVFASVPGETHTLGVTMAADFFRKDGWDVSLLVGHTHDELIDLVSATKASLVGLSVSGAHAMAALSKLVIGIHVCRPKMPILISGQSIEDHRGQIDLLGVDGVAGSVDAALAEADFILAESIIRTSSPAASGSSSVT